MKEIFFFLGSLDKSQGKGAKYLISLLLYIKTSPAGLGNSTRGGAERLKWGDEEENYILKYIFIFFP